MKCIVQGCPGEMEERRIVHTFVRSGKPIVVEDLPAWVCPVCGYTVLDLEVLGSLFAFDPETEDPVRQAPVFRLSLAPTAQGRRGQPAGVGAAGRATDAAQASPEPLSGAGVGAAASLPPSLLEAAHAAE